jgi:hypothetical protein
VEEISQKEAYLEGQSIGTIKKVSFMLLIEECNLGNKFS